MDSLIQTLAIAALPVIFAITLHEAAHGYVARYFGDPTAYAAGRISLNPLRHVDPVGTILVPVMILLLSGASILFGWAKPVPVDFSRLRRPKQDMLWVAAAGPLSNLVMAVGWAILFKVAASLPVNIYTLPMLKMADVGMDVNIGLMLLNLLPLPPLDGGRIAVSLLPYRQAVAFAQLERWGFPILLLLLFSGILSSILYPLMG
ncbi:MAG: site-2 protease family protein, partial [Betaproteobacteria bacterium]|nr:site-2 protease family protein [Betaproteobacteria bacterium]